MLRFSRRPFVELANGDKDGIPTALLEAMAAGCAIVSTDAGSILEAVDHDVEALVVPQRDGTALANAIEALTKDVGLRARLSRAAMLRVRREFDIDECEKLFHQRVYAATSGVRPQRIQERTA
jgi:colanic acid/amylovoran biosynthesis glycosyltransferase